MKRVLFIITLLSFCCGAADAQGFHNGHQWVDLGLPSGLKWATCNVGAYNPEDLGDYYAWGEIATKDSYTESTSASYGSSDSKWKNIGGDSEYDAARANWGGSWRMPTKAEFQELIDNCTWTWTTQNGHKGNEVMGRNGYSIFLPAAGVRCVDWLYYDGEHGFYWSSTPDESDTDCAYVLYFSEGFWNVEWKYCYYGHSVRPVLED